jgi:hypothetical protein
MARGEKPTSQANAIGLSFVAMFGVAALGAILFVILTTNACNSCDAWLYGGAFPVAADPYMGASTAARLLSFRDTGRLRSSWGAVPPLDGPVAHYVLATTLEARGYAPPLAEGPSFTLPAELSVPELERSCGVLEIEAEGTSHLTGAGRGTSLRAADDPSLLALGVCGDGPFRIDGVGTARIRVHLMPNLVEGDIERTGLPEDVLLAHAEAEVLFASVAYTPTDEVIRVESTSSATMVFPGLPEPSAGCVPWAVVVVGAGRSRAVMAAAVEDFAAERALVLAVSCAGGTGTSFEITDAGGDGYVAYARPYAVSTSPTLPTDVTLGLSAVHIVDAASVSLPPSVPATPAPTP